MAVDLGYRGHKCGKEYKVLHPRLKRLSLKQRCHVRRRSAIEAVISHMKRGCRMGRNFLKGALGDRINAVFAAAAFNFRKLLAVVSFVPQITMFISRILLVLSHHAAAKKEFSLA